MISDTVTPRTRQLNAYLTFSGNCAAALTFYRDCLGGSLTLQTVGESPMADQLPGIMKQQILHGTLTSGNLVIMGSDMAPEQGLQRGNSVSLMLQCYSESDVRLLYSRLAEGGQATHPPADTFWGALFGGLTDKFGTLWLLNYQGEDL